MSRDWDAPTPKARRLSASLPCFGGRQFGEERYSCRAHYLRRSSRGCLIANRYPMDRRKGPGRFPGGLTHLDLLRQ